MTEIALEPMETGGGYRDSGESGRVQENAFPTLRQRFSKGTLRVCEGCGIEFLPIRRHQRFHSSKCRKTRWDKKFRPGVLQQLDLGAPLLFEYLRAHGVAVCGFCQRLVVVDIERGGEQRVKCRCGARWFRRKPRGQLQRGWKRGKREILYA